MRSNTNYTSYSYQAPVHPLQVDNLSPSLSDTENTGPARFPLDIHNDPFPRQPNAAATATAFRPQEMDDIQVSHPSYSPTSSSTMDRSSPSMVDGNNNITPPSLRSIGRVHSLPMTFHDGDYSVEIPEELSSYHFTRHGSLDSLYPLMHSHGFMEQPSSSSAAAAAGYHAHSRFEMGAAMVPSLSSTSISSNCSLPPHHSLSGNGISESDGGGGGAITTKAAADAANSGDTTTKSKQRRASMSPDSSGRVFTCIISDCSKQFKRSEHLKRH
ncbi:hypothetical protein BGZ46_002583, partial [Entomortierella lignicola]